LFCSEDCASLLIAYNESGSGSYWRFDTFFPEINFKFV